MSPVIAISGELGSGKSSVARLLAEALGVQHFSTGDAQRAIAEKRGVSTLELNRIAAEDPTIDEEVDGLIKSLAATHESFVIDSRLAWHFIPWSFKVHLIVRPSEAVRRVESRSGVAEAYRSSEEARRALASRAALEAQRFEELYGVRIDALRNYDLVVETTRLNVEGVAEEVMRALQAQPASEPRPMLLLDPGRLRPTRAPDLEATSPGPCAADAATASEAPRPISVLRCERRYFVLDGHRRLACALEQGVRVVTAELVAEDGEPVGSLASVDAFVAQLGDVAGLESWAGRYGLDLIPDE